MRQQYAERQASALTNRLKKASLEDLLVCSIRVENVLNNERQHYIVLTNKHACLYVPTLEWIQRALNIPMLRLMNVLWELEPLWSRRHVGIVKMCKINHSPFSSGCPGDQSQHWVYRSVLWSKTPWRARSPVSPEPETPFKCGTSWDYTWVCAYF